MIVGDMNFKNMADWSDLKVEDLIRRGAKEVENQGNLLQQELEILILTEEDSSLRWSDNALG